MFYPISGKAVCAEAGIATGKERIKEMENFTERKAPAGLYDPRFEHDNCGIGAVVDIKGRKTHKTIDDALQIVEHLEHRAGKDAEGKTGDGVGILTQISDTFFQKAAAELGITLGKEREYKSKCGYIVHLVKENVLQRK